MRDSIVSVSALGIQRAIPMAELFRPLRQWRRCAGSLEIGSVAETGFARISGFGVDFVEFDTWKIVSCPPILTAMIRPS